MQWRDGPESWGLVTRLLHWLLAVALLTLLGLGLWMVRLDYYHPLYQRLPEIHRGLGLLLALPLIHAWLGYLLLGLILLHVTGALKHHFIDRDATLVRMLGGDRK